MNLSSVVGVTAARVWPVDVVSAEANHPSAGVVFVTLVQLGFCLLFVFGSCILSALGTWMRVCVTKISSTLNELLCALDSLHRKTRACRASTILYSSCLVTLLCGTGHHLYGFGWYSSPSLPVRECSHVVCGPDAELQAVLEADCKQRGPRH